MTRYNLLSKSERIRDAASRIANRVFDYHYIGQERRMITFLADGFIGYGAADREMIWNLKEIGGKVMLEIGSVKQTLVRLMEGKDSVWRGGSLDGLKAQVVLTPYDESTSQAISFLKANPAPGSWSESLFVLALPRSLSTFTYYVILRATGLIEPGWTSAGEILNFDRFALSPQRKMDESRKFIRQDTEPELFGAAMEFLSQLVLPIGYAYKDVVQPFVMAEWMKHSRFKAIRIKRNIEDIAFSMLAQGWLYPRRLFPRTKKLKMALVQGLVQADRALDSIKAEQVSFDELIQDEKTLEMALEKIMGKIPGKSIKYIDSKFIDIRNRILKRRATNTYKELSAYVASVIKEYD